MGISVRARSAASAWLLALLVIASGCTAGNADELSGSSASPPPVADPGDETGVLSVLVTDDSLAPLEGASVALPDSNSEATTDIGGRASFADLPPGTYTLFVQKLGYESAGRKVEIVAGQTLEISVPLVPVSLVVAYHQTLIFRGHISCGAGLIVVRLITVCGTTGSPAGNITVDPNHKDEFRQTGVPELQMIVGELVWSSTAALTAKEFTLGLYQNWRCTPFCSSDNNYGSATGKSPVVHRAEGPFAGLKKGPATISHIVGLPGQSAEPPFVIFVVQQDYWIYSTHFFGDPAPEAFTASPDG